MNKQCAVAGCLAATVARGLCDKHYRRRLHHGHPLSISRQPPDSGTIRLGYRCFGADHKAEHISVAEKALGRPLPNGALVHHINENRADNRNSNLVICPSNSYHQLIHRRMRAHAACGNANWLKCKFCKQHDDPVALTIRTGSGAFHAACRRVYRAKQKEMHHGTK